MEELIIRVQAQEVIVMARTEDNEDIENEDGYSYAVYDSAEAMNADETNEEGIVGGFCTGTISDALEMAQEAAEAVIKERSKNS